MVIISPRDRKIKVARSNLNKELRDRLRWSLLDLKSDAKRYDKGEFSAINRSSVTLRTIFYNSGKSKGILKQLRIEGNLRMPTFTKTFDDKDVLNYGSLQFIRFPKYFNNAKYFDTMIFRPENDTPITYLKLKKWWKQPILRLFNTDLTRENLVYFESNEDGGAHIDEQINKVFKSLRDGDSSFRIIGKDINSFMFANFIGGENVGDDVYPTYINWGLTRQIVHETLLSFNDEFNLNYMPNLNKNLSRRLNPFTYQFNMSDDK